MPKSIKRYLFNLAFFRILEITAAIESKDRAFLDLAAQTEQVRAKLVQQLIPQYRCLLDVYTDHLSDQRLITNRYLYHYGFQDGLKMGRFLRSRRRLNLWRFLKLIGRHLRRWFGEFIRNNSSKSFFNP